MPNLDFGVYEVGGKVGTEVSSTYEGRHITAHASELNHGTNLLVVTKGYPVIFGTAAGSHGVGVALNTEIAGGVDELIAVDTEGIWNLPVQGMDDAGNAVLTPGTPLFINTTTGDISAIRNNATQIPFGYLLTQCASAAAPAGVDSVQVVKVHWDPRSHWLEDQEMLYFGDDRDVSIEWDGTNLEILPLTDDTGSILIGNATHHVNSVQIFGIGVVSYLQYITAVGQFNHFNTTVGPAAQAEQHEFTQATPTMPDGMGVIENQLTVSGTAVGPFTTLESNWINLGALGVAVGYMGIRNDGIWSGGDISAAYVFMQKYTYQPDQDANWVSIWEMNWAGTNPEIDSMFNCNNPALALGYTAGAHGNVASGSIPFFSTAHGGIKYIRTYDNPA